MSFMNGSLTGEAASNGHVAEESMHFQIPLGHLTSIWLLRHTMLTMLSLLKGNRELQCVKAMVLSLPLLVQQAG